MKTERDLIKALKHISNEITKRKIDLSYYRDSDSLRIKDEIKNLENQKADIEGQLIEIEDKSLTINKRKAVEDFMSKVISKLRLSDQGYSISRNQGMILHNFIYGKIMSDIKWVFTAANEDYYSVSEPEYFHSTVSRFDHKPLKALLQSKLNELVDSNITDFVSLKAFIYEMLDEIRTLSNSDDTHEE